MRTSRIISLFAVLIIVMVAVAYNSCKKNSDDNNTGSFEEEQTFYNNILALQDKAGENYDSWLQTMDSLEAINQLQQFFLADPSVSSATIGNQGIAVQYSNGMRGGIFLNPGDHYSPDNINKSSFPNIPLSPLNGQSLVYIPKVILLNPIYGEGSFFTHQITNMYNRCLPNIGFSLVQPVYTDEKASVDRFTQLSGYGIIHIYSHGWAWPKPDNIKEVYVQTGEKVNETTSKKYWSDIENENLIIPRVKFPGYNGANVYLISEQFIASHNNFSNDTILFLGGYCYSFLGQWPQIEESFAEGAYLGFDWEVYEDWHANWVVHLIESLTDITKIEPVTVEDWMNGSDPPKSYWDEEYMKTVSIKYIGDPALTLWSGNGCPGIPSITDTRDGQVYPTVQIGNQCWLQKNMNYQTGNSWCYNNNTSNCDTYGRLYDWETALGVCPSGWHLASDNEWCILTTYIDSTVNCNVMGWNGTNVGHKMKSAIGWYANGNGNDAFGFAVLPGGYLDTAGYYIHIKKTANFWSSSVSGSNSVWGRYFDHSSNQIYRNYSYYGHGLSARCIKD